MNVFILYLSIDNCSLTYYRQIEDLTQYINKCEMKLNDVFDEVEELRERCGLDPKEPIDLGEFRAKKSVRTQEHKALNLVLQKEVTSLRIADILNTLKYFKREI